MVSGSFSLLQITDLHLLAAANSRLLGVDTAASLDAVLRAALAERAADALIVTGDIAHDATEIDVRAGARSAIATLLPRPDVMVAGQSRSCAAPLDRQRPDAANCSWATGSIIAIDTHVDGAEGGNVAPRSSNDLRSVLTRTGRDS